MKRILFILCLGAWLLALGSSPIYTDDAYYWPQTDTIVPSEPVYNRTAREFIFLEDTTLYPDTVVMRIVEK
jgi:hypothetical protein